MNFEEILENRMQRVMLIVEATTKKIVKKEFKKFKGDIVKELKYTEQRTRPKKKRNVWKDLTKW